MSAGRRILVTTTALLCVAAVAAFVTAPRTLAFRDDAPDLPADLDAYLASSEAAVDRDRAIIPGTEKRIRWFDSEAKSRREFAVVYLHGFSATRQEIAPVGELVADALQANLYETRLAGHGLASAPLSGVTAEDWLDGAVEALSIGSRIGKRIVLIGTSTGATLALAATASEAFTAVDTLVLISPNFAPADDSAEFLLLPGGAPLARLLVGPTHAWTAVNERQARYWSTEYPLDALVEMMRLVSMVRDMLPLQVDAGLLWIYSPGDRVVAVDRMIDAMRQISGRRAETLVIEDAGDPSSHVLAGDILAPGNTAAVARSIARFAGAEGR